MENMAEITNDKSIIPEGLEVKIEKRDKKRKPKMKVSGKRVFQLKNLLKK
jgi:hypothetical protein